MSMKRAPENTGQPPARQGWKWPGAGGRLTLAALLLAVAVGLASAGAPSADTKGEEAAAKTPAPPSLDETRQAMGKWIETQQIISKERKDWQQGKEILQGRLELVKKEISTLEEKIKLAESTALNTDKKRSDLLDENDQLRFAGTRLARRVTGMEDEIRRLYKMLPESLQTKLQPLYQRIPEDAEKTRVTAAERYQNVLGILNEVSKANNEIVVNLEVREFADGKRSQVKAVYIGLTQAYYVGAGGEAGIGRPGADGWTWESSKAIATDILKTLDIIEGKQTAAFVPLPVKLK
jgi:hypothetical protein